MPVENIATEERAMLITAEVYSQAPILGLVNTDLKGEFGSGSGDTVSALIPGYGTVSEGIALTGTEADWKLSVQKVPIKVTPKNMPVAYDFVEQSVKLDNFEKKVAAPYGSHLASKVREELFGIILGGATRQFVIDNPKDDFNFGFISKVLSAIQDASMNGQINCVLSNSLEAMLRSSGLNQFQASSVAFALWQGKVKDFGGADFVSQGEVIKFKAPNITSATVSAAVGEGAESIRLTLQGSSLSVIPAGYVFLVNGVNSVDIFKRDTGANRAFVVLKDATVGPGGVVDLEISPIYADQQRQKSALRNATALPAAGATVGLPLTGGATYQTGAVFDQNSIGYASAAIKAPSGVDSSTSTVDGFVNVRFVAQFDVEKGINIARFDILTGGKALYPQGVAGIWVKVG